MVIVVHGEERSGHRHVLERVQFDLVQAGNVLWRPVAALQLQKAGSPLLRRSQLAGGIARALSISDEGTQEVLEEELAKTLADRCEDGRVVVVDLQEVLKFQDQQQAQSVLTLIHELWVELMEKATTYQSTLPIFLLVSVASPQLLPGSDAKAEKGRNMRTVTEQLIAQLQEKQRLVGNVRVEVLPELEPFDQDYVAGFLEDVLELAPEQAESTAAYMVELNDNETILARLKLLLSDLEQL